MGREQESLPQRRRGRREGGRDFTTETQKTGRAGSAERRGNHSQRHTAPPRRDRGYQWTEGHGAVRLSDLSEVNDEIPWWGFYLGVGWAALRGNSSSPGCLPCGDCFGGARAEGHRVPGGARGGGREEHEQVLSGKSRRDADGASVVPDYKRSGGPRELPD